MLYFPLIIGYMSANAMMVASVTAVMLPYLAIATAAAK